MPPDEDISRSLLPRSPSSSFPQQGRVDWVLFSKNTVNFTVDALSRLSRAGGEALTIIAARAIFHQVTLNSVGE
jgi:hypothetical protein